MIDPNLHGLLEAMMTFLHGNKPTNHQAVFHSTKSIMAYKSTVVGESMMHDHETRDGGAVRLACPILDLINADFTCICSLELHLNAIEPTLELLVRACVKHLALHLCRVWGPWNSEAKHLMSEQLHSKQQQGMQTRGHKQYHRI